MTDPSPISDLATLLSRLQPQLQPDRYAFVALPADTTFDVSRAIAFIREPEGLSIVVPEAVAAAAGFPVAFVAAWITLTVHSDLEAIGLTAAVSAALAAADIGCNVIAGARHDHLFVPYAQAGRAMDVLLALQRASA